MCSRLPSVRQLGANAWLLLESKPMWPTSVAVLLNIVLEASHHTASFKWTLVLYGAGWRISWLQCDAPLAVH